MNRVLQVLTLALLLAQGGVGQLQSFQTTAPKTIFLGTLYDIHHAVIAGGYLVARDANGHDYESTTNGEGVYSFDVPAGIYKIEANANGFCPKRVNNFKATDGVLDFVLLVREEMKPCKQRSMLKLQSGPLDIRRGIAE